MHSNPLRPSEKIHFVETYKECAICAILRENTPFWGHTQKLKMWCAWSGALKMVRRGSNIMQIPLGYQKKCLLRRKSAVW